MASPFAQILFWRGGGGGVKLRSSVVIHYLTYLVAFFLPPTFLFFQGLHGN